MKRMMKMLVLLFLLAPLVTVYAQNSVKPQITGFSAIAASVEKNYGPLLELDLEMKAGLPVYQAKVVINGQRVSIYLDAVTGVEQSRRPPERLDSEDAALYGYITGGVTASDAVSSSTKKSPKPGAFDKPAISHEKAKEIALAKAGGGLVYDIELDYEKGVQVYEIEVRFDGKEYDVVVNAQTGEVLKFKQDW